MTTKLHCLFYLKNHREWVPTIDLHQIEGISFLIYQIYDDRFTPNQGDFLCICCPRSKSSWTLFDFFALIASNEGGYEDFQRGCNHCMNQVFMPRSWCLSEHKFDNDKCMATTTNVRWQQRWFNEERREVKGEKGNV